MVIMGHLYISPSLHLFLLQHSITMAPALPLFSIVLSLFFLLCSCHSTVQGGNTKRFAVAELPTLEPANVCSEWKAPSWNSLKVVHRHGPCFPSSDASLDEAQILSQESRRVAYIQNRSKLANIKGNVSMDPLQTSLEVTLPTRDGEYIDTPNYVVTITIGTPKRVQTVEFDTGSNLCWIQCMPSQRRHAQVDPIFDSIASATYRSITCNHEACTLLPTSGIEKGCTSNNVCTYHVHYGDSSSSSGLLATERMELSAPQMSPTVLPNIVFGCSQNTVGDFGRTAGMLGLGRGFHSLVTQTSGRLGNVFSYCLSSMSNVPGYLTIGRRASPSPMYTPMVTSRGTNIGLYYIDLVGITVATRRLPLPLTVFQNVGTIIDSGAVLTHLPPEAYVALKHAFRSGMSRYPPTPPAGSMDTCYTIRQSNFTFPPVTLHFNGIDLPLSLPQTIMKTSSGTYCLAFTASARGEATIIGNTQQKGMEVIYDIEARRIGFSRGTHCH